MPTTNRKMIMKMKKIYVIFLAAAVSVFAGCSGDDAKTSAPRQLTKEIITVEAGRADSGDAVASRATVVGSTSVWEAGDDILIFAESYAGKCGHQCIPSIEISEDRQLASFRGEVVKPDAMDTYYAAHPSTATVTNTYAQFTIPAIQAATAAPRILMVAKTGPASTTGLSFQFTPVDALLHVKLTGSATGIASIVMEAIGGEDLAGTYTYNFADGSTSVSGSKSITVNTGGLTDFYVTLPAVTLSSGYKLTYYAGGQKMVRSYGAGAVKEFRKGDAVNLAVDAFDAVAINYVNGFKSSYDYYNIGEIGTANTMGGDVIHGTGVHSVSYTTTGISSTLISDIGVILDGNRIPYTAGTWNKSAKTFAVGDHTMSWGDHTAQLYMICDGTEVRSDLRTISITGLPYYAAPPKDSGTYKWTGKSGGSRLSFESSYVHLETGAGPNPTITSPSFHVPGGSINVLLSTDCNVRAYQFIGWITTDFTVKVSGTTIITQSSGKINGRDYSLSANGVLTSSNPTIVCASSATTINPYARVYNIRMIYR